MRSMGLQSWISYHVCARTHMHIYLYMQRLKFALQAHACIYVCMCSDQSLLSCPPRVFLYGEDHRIGRDERNHLVQPPGTDVG